MFVDTQHFSTLLQQEIEQVNLVHQLLLKQQAAITTDDLTQLHDAQQQLELALAQLQQTAVIRSEWMQSQGLSLDNSCLEHPELKDSLEITSFWGNLEQAYLKNQELAVSLSDTALTLRLRTQQKLNVLQGKNDEAGLYNKDGKTHQASTGPKIQA